MNVTLSPDAENLIRETVESGEFKDASDFVHKAIRCMIDMDETEAELDCLVREGIESGPAAEMTREEFEAIRRDS